MPNTTNEEASSDSLLDRLADRIASRLCHALSVTPCDPECRAMVSALDHTSARAEDAFGDLGLRLVEMRRAVDGRKREPVT